MDNSTIVAIATPNGTGGIGIIKISGCDALKIGTSIFRKHQVSGKNSYEENYSLSSEFKSHHLYYGNIINPENDQVIDEVLFAFMKAPHSYTREDVVEIQAHSGSVVLGTILSLLLKHGALLAKPGEFTKRAYLNGRIDLTQAEAVIDVINAKTTQALEIANKQIKGDLKKSIESLRDEMLNLLAEIELAIDFYDDHDDEIVENDQLLNRLQNNIINKLEKLIEQYDYGIIIKDGINVAIIGRPNVGKSSLLNRLIQKERSIVTPIPGTTRDIIEENLIIRGVSINIADTAGLHKSDDLVETIGIKKTQEHIKNSHVVLFLINAGFPITEDESVIFQQIKEKKVILVFNKIDLVENSIELEVPEEFKNTPSVKISALYNSGIDKLKELIAEECLNQASCNGSDNPIIPNLRHKSALERSLRSLTLAAEGIKVEKPFELIAIDIDEGIKALDEILGINTRQDIIDQIFERFCIGK